MKGESWVNWYQNQSEEWKNAIGMISEKSQRNELMVEKDVIQSMFLSELSKLELPFVFKGGTSLSKAYQLIDRFSEDIDLSVSRHITNGEHKKAKQQILEIADSLGLTLDNPEDIRSRRDYNKYLFSYDSLFRSESMSLMIETSFFQSVYPIEQIPIHNYISDYCQSHGITIPLPLDELNFSMAVQSLNRTFIDKTYAVCDYWVQGVTERDSRHLYDLAQLCSHVPLNSDLHSLAVSVRKDRMFSINNPAAQPEYNIQQILSELITTDYFKKDYETVTSRLLNEPVSYEESLENGIQKILDSKVFDFSYPELSEFHPFPKPVFVSEMKPQVALAEGIFQEARQTVLNLYQDQTISPEKRKAAYQYVCQQYNADTLSAKKVIEKSMNHQYDRDHLLDLPSPGQPSI